ERAIRTQETYEGAKVERSGAVQQAIAADLERADKERAHPIGVAISHPLDRASKQECALSNLIVDLVRASVPRADAAVDHRGSVPASPPAGPLRLLPPFLALSRPPSPPA